MSLLTWFFLLHLVLCGVFLILRVTGVIHSRYILLLTAFLVPVCGAAIMVLQTLSDRRSDRASEWIDVNRRRVEEGAGFHTHTDASLDINRSIYVDEDRVPENVVPLSEAMIVNDPAIRRELMLDVLYTDPDAYIGQLSRAKSNDDTEVVHYAATALAEIQKKFDQDFHALMKRHMADPEDKSVDDAYLALLERYIASGLLHGEGLKRQLASYSRMLSQQLAREDVKGRWSLLRKKADADLQLEDADALEQDIRQMQEQWPERSEVCYYALQCAVLRQDRDEIQRLIRTYREQELHLSREMREAMEFWVNEGRQGTA